MVAILYKLQCVNHVFIVNFKLLAAINLSTKHIEAETKWTPFCTHFQIIFLYENYHILIQISLKYVPKCPCNKGGGWGCEVSCSGYHRLRRKTTMGSALDEAVFDITQILAYLVHDMSRSQLYFGFGHFD